MSGIGGSWEEGRCGVDVDAESVWTSEIPVTTTKFRLAAWSGEYILWSFHIRGRGGTTNNWTEIDSLLPDGTMSNNFKSMLVQYVDITKVEPWSYIVSAPYNVSVRIINEKPRLEWLSNNWRYLDQYKIYRDLNSPATTLIDSVSANTHFYTDTLLTSGLTYYYRLTAVSIDGSESEFSNEVTMALETSDTDDSDLIPIEFALHQNYPNPFNPAATIRYDLPQASDVSLFIYDILGREVTTIVNESMVPGYHRIIWDGRDQKGVQLPSGVYIARIVTPEYSKSIKMVLLK